MKERYSLKITCRERPGIKGHLKKTSSISAQMHDNQILTMVPLEKSYQNILFSNFSNIKNHVFRAIRKNFFLLLKSRRVR